MLDRDHKKHHALEDSNTQLQLGYQLADKGRKTTEEEEYAQENPEIMMDAQVILFCRTHAENKRWQSHEHRLETYKEYSCCDPLISMTELPPTASGGEDHSCRNLITSTTTSSRLEPKLPAILRWGKD